MKNALAIALREIKSYLQDRGDLAFSLLLPVVTFALIYGAFGGQGLFHGTAYIVNGDSGPYSQSLITALKNNSTLTVQVLSTADADAKLGRSDITLAMFIPADFSSNLAAGNPAQVTFKQRGNGGQEGQIVSSMEGAAISDLNMGFQVQSVVGGALNGKGISSALITSTVQQALDQEKSSPGVTVAEENIGSSPDPVNEFLPGIITMYVLFAITIGARAFAEEKRRGTLERLLTTRLTPGQLFTGKFLAGMGRGFVQTVILLVLSYAVFHIFTPLSFIEVIGLSLVFAAAGGAVGMLIASIARTPDSANWIAVFFTMGTVMLGGTFFTLTKGTVIYTLSRFSINTYANEAFKALVARSGTFADVGLPFIILAGVTIFALVISHRLFSTVSGKR
jgi:ABC-2 type transport system permease protein